MKVNYLFTILLLAFFLSSEAQVYPASNFTLVGQLDPEPLTNADGDKYSGCWGWYQASKNKEYAILGSQSGTYWVDVSNPATPTVSAYKAGAISGATWREIKTYQNYCYVISDDFGNNTFQIFDMQYLPDSVSKIYDSQSLFKRAHAAWVDGNKLYLSSVTYSNNNYSSMNVYSLANPATPTLLRRLNQDYSFINGVHDMFVRNDTVFASCGYQGLYVFKFTASNTFSQLGSLTSYPSSGYNHSSALTPNGQNLVFMDEVPNGLPIKTANVSNLANIQVLATTNQFAQTTPHNPFMLNAQYCLASSYQEGLQLYDISTPNAPILSGYFDTYPQGGGNVNNWGSDPYKGLWGAYPWLPSKTIIALDMVNGLFLLKTAMYQNVLTVSNFVLPNTICAGKTYTPINNSVGATNYTWTLNDPISNVSTSTLVTPGFTFNTPGVYSITLLASNPSFSSTSTKTILATAAPLGTLTTAVMPCANCGTITASVSGGTSPYTYSWTPTGGSAATATNLALGCYTVTITDINGCKSFTSACLSLNVGLNGLTQNAQPAIYPNPANDLLTIEHQGNTFDYSLRNGLGELILGGSNEQDKTELHLEAFAPGIYFLEVKSGTITQRSKIIIGH